MKKIEITIGQLDRISFASNAGSTGYVWMLASMPGNVFLVDVDDVPPTTPMPGKPGTRVFTIVGARPGHGKLTFVLARPWQISAPAQQVSYDVEVTMDHGPIVLYGPALTEARARGDLAEMKALASQARDALAQQGDLANALADLEAEITKAGG